MEPRSVISGFSRLSKEEKIALAAQSVSDPQAFSRTLKGFWHGDPEVQQLLDEFSENTVGNFPLPFGLAPNFLINDEVYLIPMVIEESSVVAAASKAAKWWFKKGGFKAQVVSTIKPGHVYFTWKANPGILRENEAALAEYLLEHTMDLTENMRKRGGGIQSIQFLEVHPKLPSRYKLEARFETADSMGANFINTCLEAFAALIPEYFHDKGILIDEHDLGISLSILSNYTPECLVSCSVSCGIEEFAGMGAGLGAVDFAERFREAVEIAVLDPARAVTHNKGIFNGLDAVVMATGNDYRAVEAGAHAYAARTGNYASLTRITLSGGEMNYELELPLSIGTVGGLTRTHPMAKLALDILGYPSAEELMHICAAAGLANNFSAIWSLVTSGIQQGHMKMHLTNILNTLNASPLEKETAMKHFTGQSISYRKVSEFLKHSRESGISGQ